MSLDAQAMLEVNRQAIFDAAKKGRQLAPDYPPLVVSIATFGRGIRQELLRELETHRTSWGHNQSLVAIPPVQLVQKLLADPTWKPHFGEPPSAGFGVMGYAFGKSRWEWWKWEDESEDALF